MKKRRNPLQQEFFSISEVSDHTGVSRGTVYNWIHRDGLNHYRTPSGYILIKKADLEAFLAKTYEAG